MKKTLVSPEVQLRVEQLQTDYTNCIDDERYAEWPTLFAENCLYKIISRDNHRKKMPFGFLYCDNRRMLRDRIASMANANVFEPHCYRHILSRSEVSHADGVLVAKTGYIVFRIMHDGSHALFSTGTYLDQIIEVKGEFVFKERVVVTDSSSIDALLVIPL